ncbi:MAG: hypothetical protein M3O26_14020 [Pseudomonadota bacterium]|nr:hypothetical protein [Pseudomonadota bacterium]
MGNNILPAITIAPGSAITGFTQLRSKKKRDYQPKQHAHLDAAGDD